jgi:hypothetical protein
MYSSDEENDEQNIAYSMMDNYSGFGNPTGAGVDDEGNRIREYNPEALFQQQIGIICAEFDNINIQLQNRRKTKGKEELAIIIIKEASILYNSGYIIEQADKLPVHINKGFLNPLCFIIACVCYAYKQNIPINSIGDLNPSIIEDYLGGQIKGEIFNIQDLVRYYRMIENSNLQ